MTGSYDPATNTLIWGVGNPGRTGTTGRPGDNLYTDSSLALDADTGKIKWHYQHTPNDPYDYDSVAENVLVDVPAANGTTAKLALEAVATALPMRSTAPPASSSGACPS